MNEHSSFDTNKEPIFSRKKSLLTVGQYAARQGVSTGIVQQAAKLGVVQVRKHKDKTFIVDLPLDAYKVIKQQDSDNPESLDSTDTVNKISELVNKIFKSDNILESNLHKTAPSIGTPKSTKPSVAAIDLTIKHSPDISQAAIPDLKLFAEEENNALSLSRQPQNEPDRFHIPLLRKMIDSIKAMPTRKFTTVIVTVAFAISLCAYIWSNINGRIQQEKLRQAYASIGNLMTEYENTKQKARLYEFDMMSLQSQAETSKRTLYNYETELSETRKRLYETRKDLRDLQQYNTETLKTLNEQINKTVSKTPTPATE
ncbi:MAG: hypothetical protein PHP01_02485 [Phycisphaerae bacterium]|nr:hypothetical protein [Phycisphaerae bacterium]